jgi:hypothetical protein
VVRRNNRRYGVGKAFTIDRLGQHRCSRYLFVDALDGVAVRIPGDEDDRCLAHLVQPPSDLDPFAASFEIDVIEATLALAMRAAWRANRRLAL